MSKVKCPKCGSDLFDGEYCRKCDYRKPIKFRYPKGNGNNGIKIKKIRRF